MGCRREIELLSKLAHTNVVEYIESFQDING
jgi:hypothetical protein